MNFFGKKGNILGKLTREGLFSSIMNNVITTPLFYVNASPHIGHAYSIIIADALKRWKSLNNNNKLTTLITGTDEHGLKVFKSSKKANIEPKLYCDRVSNEFKVSKDVENILFYI